MFLYPIAGYFKNRIAHITKTPAFFEWKTDLIALYSYLSKYTVNDDLRTATKQFLEINKPDEIDSSLKNLTWADIVKAIYYKRNGKFTGKEKLYQIINSRILYATLDELKRIEKPSCDYQQSESSPDIDAII